MEKPKGPKPCGCIPTKDPPPIGSGPKVECCCPECCDAIATQFVEALINDCPIT